MDTQLSKITRPLPLIPRAAWHGFKRTGRTIRVQPTFTRAPFNKVDLCFSVMDRPSCLALNERVNAAEPHH
jgi:hypothetical protein